MPFGVFKLHPDLLQAVKELGFVRPTAIQADAIPPALEGRDVLACATTGSGKTAAFVLPILHRLIARTRGTTRALVLTPTRELAAQVLQDLNDLAVHTPLTATAIYGGVAFGPQEHAFRSGVDVLVATPGRLLDHLRHSYASLSGIEFLVLDEADRMLDMGFLPDVRRIVRRVPSKRQTLFFSATIPAGVMPLTQEMLRDPITINLERRATPAVGITQAVYTVSQVLKPALLLALIDRELMREALVFTRTKVGADRLWDFLHDHGISVAQIHGDRTQRERTEALEGFKSGKYRVLVATDIAARGIDVEALGHVVNFDVPSKPDDYIHRVGRTARAELTGDAFTFVAAHELADLHAIERAIGKSLPRITLTDFDYSGNTSGRQAVPAPADEEFQSAVRPGKRGKGRKKELAPPSSGSGSDDGGRQLPPDEDAQESVEEPLVATGLAGRRGPPRSGRRGPRRR